MFNQDCRLFETREYVLSFQLLPYFPHFGGPNSWRFIYNPYELLTIVRDSQGISYYSKRFPGNFLLFQSHNLEKTTLVVFLH